VNGRHWLVTLTAVGIVALLISGSSHLGITDETDSFAPTHRHYANLLDSIDARIDQIPEYGVVADTLDPLLTTERLRERSARIAAALDSVESMPESRRLGALAGLRASLADLEYRVDVAALDHASDTQQADSLLGSWFADAEQRLDSAEQLIIDSVAATGYAQALQDARTECGRLATRFGSMRVNFPDDVAPRRSLGRDLALFRRDVRATVRSIRPGTRPADPEI
jgi:hypothetical protein